MCIRDRSTQSTWAQGGVTHPAMLVTHVITRLIVGGAQENTLATVLGLRAFPDVEVRLISGPSLGPEGSLAARAAAIPGLLQKKKKKKKKKKKPQQKTKFQQKKPPQKQKK
eukprot:TRINITY_DN21516_c0_g1_i1.p4 TRINITY_DN21516_c0_g1~~TRINITY_DN21516_c0_g1_i1.p4  ORF type:complete len:111 (-),score=30.18 TRINITY_DN21516_c0_g1_i1:86-418(-)